MVFKTPGFCILFLLSDTERDRQADRETKIQKEKEKEKYRQTLLRAADRILNSGTGL